MIGAALSHRHPKTPMLMRTLAVTEISSPIVIALATDGGMRRRTTEKGFTQRREGAELLRSAAGFVPASTVR
ncbi:hypothetical protein [Novosphingobium colocasiae]|uniref:hypothetical protein n=1 Tax=Novosphingobium colocasiae TaxID=1256513 RepID=UPI00167214BF|nr:hypothetical protein [Novosphingobium colocasiae]